jgi:hypothetical protein
MGAAPLFALACALACAGGDGAPTLRWLSTEHVGRLTGTPSNPIADVGLSGTDLGVSFAASGKLVFLFGDSWTIDRKDWDADSVALARTDELPRAGLPILEWLKQPDGRFLQLAPRGMKLGGMDVPVEGLAVQDATYVFFDSGWDQRRRRHTHSILARCRKLDFHELELVHTVPSDKFLNVSVVADGGRAWIFGTGAYRKSGVYLARVPLNEIGDRAAWRYAPEFVAGEANARALVAADDLGEFGVRKLPRTRLWLMASNGARPRGIQLRCAEDPRGPWSAPLVIFDPERDRGYGRFLHRSAAEAGYDDGLSDEGRANESGGAYGPYLVPEWCRTPAPGVHELVYVLSSWNPYAVHLMRTRVAEPGAPWTEPARPRAAGGRELLNPRFEGGRLDGWTAEGDAFAVTRRVDGEWEVCTHAEPKRDAVRGRLWQEFRVPADARELRCTLRGGTESVRLVREGNVLRETRGPRTNDADVLVRWSIEDYRGLDVRVEISDDSGERWGFVTARGFELAR